MCMLIALQGKEMLSVWGKKKQVFLHICLDERRVQALEKEKKKL